MNIQLGDAGQIVQLAQVGLEIYRGLKESGALNEAGRELAEIHRNVRRHCAKMDVEQLRYYEEEGKLSREQALHLLEVNKITVREMLGERKGKSK